MLQSVVLMARLSGITREDDLIFREITFDAFSIGQSSDDTVSFRCDAEGISRTVVPSKDVAGKSNFSVSFCTKFPSILRSQKNSFIEMRNRDDHPTLNIVMLIADIEMDFVFNELRSDHVNLNFSFLPEIETDHSYVDGDVLVFPGLVALSRGSGWSGRFDVSYYSFGSTINNY